MKVTVLGGGGFRVPMMYRALSDARADLGLGTVVLHDVAADRLLRIGRVLEGMERERPIGIVVSTTERLDEALEGADVVLCAIRVGGADARVVDERVPMSFGVLGQETVGPAGIAFALRTVPVVDAVAERVARLAPHAWFLNFTNPAGLVTEAAEDTLGPRAIGICDSPSALCRGVAALLGRATEDLSFEYFGLNHLGWLRRVLGPEGDLLPELVHDEDRLSALPEAWAVGTACIRELGMIPNEYLAYYLSPDRIRAAFAAAGRTRGEVVLAQQRPFYEAPPDEDPQAALRAWRRAKELRDRTYMAEARGVAPDPAAASDPVAEQAQGAAAPGDDATAGNDDDPGYAGVAVACLRALLPVDPSDAHRETVEILGVANAGSLPFLDADAVVEVPCRVTPTGAAPVEVGDVPRPQRVLIERVKAVERTTIRAARARSAALAVEALAMHPLVPSPDAAERIFAAYAAAHPALEGFS